MSAFDRPQILRDWVTADARSDRGLIKQNLPNDLVFSVAAFIDQHKRRERCP